MLLENTALPGCPIALLAFTVCGSALAMSHMFYIVKDKAGKMKVIDKRPENPGMVGQGPFKSKEEALKAMEAAKKSSIAFQPSSTAPRGCPSALAGHRRIAEKRSVMNDTSRRFDHMNET